MTAVAAIAIGVTWVVLASLAWFLYHLVRQNGRLLLRVEALEKDLGQLRVASDMNRSGRSPVRSRINRDGLPQGRLAPPFRLPRVGGGDLSLDEYAGRRVLLVFSDPNCGPCNVLAPRLERQSRPDSGVDIVMVSRGDASANRAKIAEYGLTFPVVLQQHWEVSRAYGKFVTPMAYLIDERGIIAADVAVGMDSILELLTTATARTASAPRGAHVVRH
jgi:peroxiredoxin